MAKKSKPSVKAAMKKFEGSKADEKMDKAGAKKLAAKKAKR